MQRMGPKYVRGLNMNDNNDKMLKLDAKADAYVDVDAKCECILKVATPTYYFGQFSPLGLLRNLSDLIRMISLATLALMWVKRSQLH